MIGWDQLHGALTHFPIALLLFCTACDFGATVFKRLPFARELRVVSFYALLVAALASVGVVASGVALTRGDLWGRGDFGWYHRFVWPAFALLVALAVWRLVVRDTMSPTGFWCKILKRAADRGTGHGWRSSPQHPTSSKGGTLTRKSSSCACGGT